MKPMVFLQFYQEAIFTLLVNGLDDSVKGNVMKSEN